MRLLPDAECFVDIFASAVGRILNELGSDDLDMRQRRQLLTDLRDGMATAARALDDVLDLIDRAEEGDEDAMQEVRRELMYRKGRNRWN